MESAHWQFAMQYFGSVLEFVFVVGSDLEGEELNKRKKVVNIAIYVAYGMFYSLVVILYVVYTCFFDAKIYHFLRVTLTCLPATLLLVAVFLFRCKVRHKEGFYSNERMMVIHAAIFFTYLLFTIA